MLLKHYIFTTKELRKFEGVKGLWSLLRGITSWVLWIERNYLVFNGEWWHVQKLHYLIWKSLFEYGKVDWERCVVKIKKFPNVEHKKLMAFDKVHGENTK
jgi:hypothetical protein